MLNLSFMTDYKENVNEIETVKLVKQHLQFLHEYTSSLAARNSLKNYLVEEEEILDHLPYTRSILYQNKKGNTIQQSTRVLEAIEKHDKNNLKNKRLQEERRLHYQWLMSGIQHLNDEHQTLLLDKYVHNQNNTQLCYKRGQISLSTLHRTMRKACLQLAMLLDLEVLK